MKALLAGGQGVKLGQVACPLAGRGQVLLRVLCAGLCRTDLYAGTGQIPVAPGRVLGHEFCGLVESVGPGVDNSWLGRRVAVFPWIGCGTCRPCQSSVEGAALCAERLQMGIDRDGCFAALTAVPADRLVALPEASDNRAGAYAEPVAAALGAEDVLPEGARVGLFGDNRIASLTERLLVRSGRRPVRTAEANSLDFALESSAALPNLEQAMVCLRPEGTLVVKSRPPGPVAWPLRLQVEKRLKVLAAGYGSFQRAVVLVSEHPELFKDLWSDPLTLEAWPELFARERSGQETRKAFLLPNPA